MKQAIKDTDFRVQWTVIKSRICWATTKKHI